MYSITCCQRGNFIDLKKKKCELNESFLLLLLIIVEPFVMCDDGLELSV